MYLRLACRCRAGEELSDRIVGESGVTNDFSRIGAKMSVMVDVFSMFCKAK